jgi:hypothetical protein
MAEFDLAGQSEARARFPALDNRKLPITARETETA